MTDPGAGGATRILRAGLACWAMVFAAGFVLGTLRVLLVVPAIGELAAVLLELPLMLVIGWFAARAVTRRWRIGRAGEALACGMIAFAVLMATEALLAIALFDRTLAAWLADMGRAPGALGLAGQVAFAFMPLLARPRPA